MNMAYGDQLMEHLHPDDARTHLVDLGRALAGRCSVGCADRLTDRTTSRAGLDDVATGFHLRAYTNAELIKLFATTAFVVAVPGAGRGRSFRMPAQGRYSR